MNRTTARAYRAAVQPEGAVMFWEIFQQARIHEVESTADTARSRASDAMSSAAEVRAALDRLVLVNRAMWEILSKQHGLTERELDDKVEEIDLRDGRRDSRLKKAIRECPRCARTMSLRHARCLYCGHQESRDPFDTVG
ncbi:MAG: hypothetical protein KDB80_17735 [Planctomycetes bacterium]|nr:hypothetical protein [Planctomycetota bacterium]